MATKEFICLDCKRIHEAEDCVVLVLDTDPSAFWGQRIVSRKQIEVCVCPACGSEKLDPVIELDLRSAG